MLIRKPGNVAPSEITSPEAYARRREFLKLGAGALAAAALVSEPRRVRGETAKPIKLFGLKASPLSTDEKANTYEQVTSYNNFYEFGTAKDDPADNAHMLRVRPWTVVVEGEVRKPRTFDIDDIMKLAPLEERVYRLRCVEGWSMVIPWVGYSLSHLIKSVEPTANAKYIEYVTLADPQQMPGVRSRVLEWPYVEGLRMDEATHPLTLLAIGLYGQTLPSQNGAPVRVVVPWKYGFKSGKSIVKIRFAEHEPRTAWVKANPGEYGFYSNVNPDVDHPRWSQSTERRIGEFGKRKTLLFNGYADEVASLYAGMDLKKVY